MTVVVAGGTGFIGRRVVSALINAGHKVVILSRSAEKASQFDASKVTFRLWDPDSPTLPLNHINGADAVINLCGSSLISKHVLTSRLRATRRLVETIQKVNVKPKTLINASAIGYYNGGFLGDVCKQWEGAASLAQSLGVRVAYARFGIIFGKNGGALKAMRRLNGRQSVSWIHVDDAAQAILFILKTPSISGPIDVTSPNPVSMDVLHRGPKWLRIPPLVLRAVLGEAAGALIEGSQVLPEKLIQAGFSFQYPDLDSALKEIES